MKTTAKRTSARKPLPIESGMVDNHADRPYNRLQRVILRFMGLCLGRQIV